MVAVQQDIQALTDKIRRLEQTRDSLTKCGRALAKPIRAGQFKCAYYRLAQRVRSPSTSYGLWTMGVMVIGPLVFAFAGQIFMHVLSRSLPLSLGFFGIGAIVGVVVFGALLFVPRAEVSAVLDAHERTLHERLTRQRKIGERLRTAIQALDELRAKRGAIVASAQYQRAQLLRREWKAMRDADWERFLAEVCLTLGLPVELTAKTGDQGVDLVVQSGTRRIAVQAKGYFHSVGNGAVQEVVAGARMHKCDSCAVITNSRFTPAAKELAAANRCVLIGEDEFPEFVMGNVAL